MSIKTMEGWKGGISELKGKQREIAGAAKLDLHWRNLIGLVSSL